MPITKSAKKALRQNKRRREKNLRKFDVLKETIKKFKKLIAENKKEEAIKLLPQLYKVIDKSCKGGLIKKNTADRKKSRLTKTLNKKEVKVLQQTAPAQQ
jgi:small subunit ribosomal protein S20